MDERVNFRTYLHFLARPVPSAAGLQQRRFGSPRLSFVRPTPVLVDPVVQIGMDYSHRSV